MIIAGHVQAPEGEVFDAAMVQREGDITIEPARMLRAAANEVDVTGMSGRPSRPTGSIASDSGMSWYILILLTAAYGLSYIDRQLLNLLVDPVKRSLLLSDVQISFLQGTAFVSAYCLAAPLLGRVVDVASRRAVLICCVATWSVCTILCGMTSTFWQFALARFGVGCAEACIFPVAWSLIPELFSRERGARAYSVFTLGSNVGSALSLLFGGAIVAAAGGLILSLPMLSRFAPWQIAFIIVGLPGLLFCALLFTMPEPTRQVGSGVKRFSFAQSVALIRGRGRFYGGVYAANGMLSIVALSIPAWFPAFLARVYGVSTGEIGLYFGLTLLCCSTTGLMSGPIFARWLAVRGFGDAPLRVAATSTIGMAFLSLALPLAPNAAGAIVLVGLLTFFTTICTPLLGFACQQATPPQVRGFASSLYTFSAMVVGYAIGPLLVAGMTDRVFSDVKMVGHSIQLVCTVASILTGFFLVRTWRPYRELMAADDDAL